MVGFALITALVPAEQANVLDQPFITQRLGNVAEREQHDLQRRDPLLAVDNLARANRRPVSFNQRADDNRPKEMLMQLFELVRANLLGMVAVQRQRIDEVDNVRTEKHTSEL